jgi:hypothetical protein
LPQACGPPRVKPPHLLDLSQTREAHPAEGTGRASVHHHRGGRDGRAQAGRQAIRARCWRSQASARPEGVAARDSWRPINFSVVAYWQWMSCCILFARKLCQRINDDGKTFHARTRLAVRVIARNISCPTGCCYDSSAAAARATALAFARGSSSTFQVSVTQLRSPHLSHSQDVGLGATEGVWPRMKRDGASR